MHLRSQPSCQRYLFDIPDEEFGPVARAMDRFGATRVLSDWVPLPLVQFPNEGPATSRFGYMAGTSSVVVFPATLGAEIAAAGPGFTVLPVEGDVVLAMVPGERDVARECGTDLVEVFQTWPSLEVAVDFVAAAIPRDRFFSLTILTRRYPVGLFLAVEEGVEPPALYRWLVDDPASGWSATEVWTSATGPIAFWR